MMSRLGHKWLKVQLNRKLNMDVEFAGDASASVEGKTVVVQNQQGWGISDKELLVELGAARTLAAVVIACVREDVLGQ